MNNLITAAFNIKPENIESIHSIKEDGSLNIHITLSIKPMECPICGAKAISHGKHKKTIKHPAILDFDGNIIWYARRYKCTQCSHTFLEHNPFAFAGLSISIATQRAIMFDLKNPNLTYKDIAQRHHVSSFTVQKLFDSWVNIPRLKLPQSIGIDEIHSDMAIYGSSYLCVLVDNMERSLFEILPSRSKDYLNKYLEKIPQSEKDNVRYITVDMWDAYIDVAQKNFKNAIIAVDPFHVIKHLGECFSRIRINIQNQVVYDSDTYYLLKSWHRLLETDFNLDNEPRYNGHFKKNLNYRNLYDMLLDINENLTCAYQLKEMYRRFNKEATFENASEWLDEIISAFLIADIPEYRSFIDLIKKYRPYILNSFKRPYDNRKLSNALSENINSQIRANLSVSRGAANFTRFRKRMIYSLNNKIFYSATEHLKSDKRTSKPRGNYKK